MVEYLLTHQDEFITSLYVLRQVLQENIIKPTAPDFEPSHSGLTPIDLERNRLFYKIMAPSERLTELTPETQDMGIKQNKSERKPDKIYPSWEMLKEELKSYQNYLKHQHRNNHHILPHRLT